MTTRSAGSYKGLTEQLMAPDFMARFLAELQSRTALTGMVIDLDPEAVASQEVKADINPVIKRIANAINTYLGLRETVVALLLDAHVGSYLMASSADPYASGGSPLGEALKLMLEHGRSSDLGACTRITSEGRVCADGGTDGGNGIVVPILIGDSLIGLVGAVNEPGKPITPEQEAKLLLTVVILGDSAQEAAGWKATDERFRSLAHTLSGAIDARDPRARGHSHRVAMYAMAIMNELACDAGDEAYQDLRNQTRIAALLHDIGKIGIPDSILLKQGSRDESESQCLKQHAALGAEIVKSCCGLRDIVPGILYHHERFDGSGYPFGLMGEDIPLPARVIALADAFDTMTSDHGGPEVCSHEEAIESLTGRLSDGFDPDVIEAFCRAHDDGALSYVRLSQSPHLRGRAVDGAVEKIYGRQLKSIPALPDTLYKVNSLLDNPEASLKEIGRLLSTDTGLASRVLKLVNSAYYGLPRTVSTIPLATTILGIRAIKSHVVNIAYADAMRALGGRRQEYDILWEHALRTATWARGVSSEISDIDVEEAFTAGLIHDVGRILCLRLKAEPYSRLVMQSHVTGRPLLAAEEEVIGFDHMSMGGWMGAKWMLPDTLVNAIEWHHTPECAAEKGRETYEFVRIMHIADIAARACEAVDTDFVPFMLRELSPRVLRELGSSYVVDLERFKTEVEEAEEELEETFAEAVLGAS